MSQLYLWIEQRKLYIKQLTDIKELFFERIEPVFANAEKEADKYADKLWEDAMNAQVTEEEYEMFDPASYAEDVQMAGLEKYELLSVMRYRTLGMWIALLCQVWEQQIFTFVVDESRRDGLVWDPKDMQKGFEFSKHVFKYHGIDFKCLSCWNKIRELRALVNVLKHAEGYSADRLRELRPDYFKFYGMDDSLKLDKSSLLDETLSINNEDFAAYFEALVGFWIGLPERMYTEGD